jgi:SAM-dependent methyltransferase
MHDIHYTGEVTMYEAAYFQEKCGGTPYGRTDSWISFFSDVADRIVRDFQPKNVIDVGCAQGILAEQLIARGVHVWGIDSSSQSIEVAKQYLGDHVAQARLDEPLPKEFPAAFDIALCLEMIENVETDKNQNALDNLVAYSDKILFSASPDFSQPQSVAIHDEGYWGAQFARRHFFRDMNYSATYISPWAVLFTQSQDDISTIVADYELKYSRLVQENAAIKENFGDSANNADEPAELSHLSKREQLMEIMRQRDEIIGLQREKGELQKYISGLEVEHQLLKERVERFNKLANSKPWRLARSIVKRIKNS